MVYISLKLVNGTLFIQKEVGDWYHVSCNSVGLIRFVSVGSLDSINLFSIENQRYDLTWKQVKKNFAIGDPKKQRVGFILPIEPLPGLIPRLLLLFLFPHSSQNQPQYAFGT